MSFVDYLRYGRMYKIFIPVIVCLLLFTCCRSKKYEVSDIDISDKVIAYQTVSDISVDDIRYHIGILASDSLEGRKAGSIGEKKAGEYIKNKFSDLGLNKFSDDYYHPFSFLPRMPIYDCELYWGNFEAVYKRDFNLIIGVDSAVISSDVVFVGNGVNYSNDMIFFNDDQDIDIENKWIMIFERDKDNKLMYKMSSGITEDSVSKRKSASGILVINKDGDYVVSDEYFITLVNGKKLEKPIVRISKNMADSLFKYADTSTEEMLEALNSNNNISFSIPVDLNGSIFLKKDSVKSDNVIAYIEGKDSVLRNEYIVIGAHHDHMGIQKKYNLSGDEDLIYNGADDNASGVAGILEIAEKLVSDGNTKRSIIFMTYGAEEEGLKGSDYISKNLPVPASEIKLMINFDMIGRLDSGKLYVNTVVGSTPVEKVIKNLSHSYPD